MRLNIFTNPDSRNTNKGSYNTVYVKFMFFILTNVLKKQFSSFPCGNWQVELVVLES